MATLTKAQMADLVLENLLIKPAGQAANGNDKVRVQKAVDSTHDELRKFGLAPYATSAIPTWAQDLLKDYVSGRIAKEFGHSGQALAEYKGAMIAAERDMARQVSGYKHQRRVVAEYF